MKYSNFSTDYNKSRGRIYEEVEDPHRTCFMRDRDRIIHSSAFRRLKYKTQVFVYNEEDYYRTRLSHSIEVSQLARSIAKIFRVNDDLTESISLSHDLGHTPFGHAGEDELNKKMLNKGGFNHNYQAIKILTLLENKYLNFDGLNLTFETLDGIVKHNGPIHDKKVPIYILELMNKFDGNLKQNGSIESQIAAICDDIAYNNNDIDDGLHAELFKIEELEQLEIIKNILKNINFTRNEKPRRLKYELVRNLIKLMVDDLIRNTKKNIKHFQIDELHDVQSLNNNIVCFSDHMEKEEKKIKKFLRDKMYDHPVVKTMNYKAKKIISDLFELFSNEPNLMPKSWKIFDNETEKFSKISDYISGMTDKYAINIHKKFFNLYNF